MFSSEGSIEYPLVLQRVPPSIEPSLRSLAELQFPSDRNSCLNTSIYLSIVDGTWGNSLLNLNLEFTHNSNSIVVPFTTRTGNLNDNVFLADSNACPSLKNKWQCLFLESTNCPIPNALTNCFNRNCLNLGKVYSNASLIGTLLSDTQVKELYKDHTNRKSFINNIKVKKAIRMRTKDVNNRFTNESTEVIQTDTIQDYHTLNFLFGMYYYYCYYY